MIRATTTASRRFRSRRDALIGALQLGEPPPLQDLPVMVEPRIVPYHSVASVRIQDTEDGTAYSLRDVGGSALPSNPAAVPGNGGDIVLPTPEVVEDVEYSVRADVAGWIWQPPAMPTPPRASALLLATAEVKVGLDADLHADLESDRVPPNLIDYGATVKVAIRHSQEGVEYRLVHFPNGMPNPEDFSQVNNDAVLSVSVNGTGGDIHLTSIALAEDTTIRVRSIKRFEQSEGRPPQTTVLKAEVPVFVRANPALVPVAKTAVVDYNATSDIAVNQAQASAHYVFWRRAIADRDYTRHAVPGALKIDAAEGPVFVRPPLPDPTPAGFTNFGDTGRGADGAARVTLQGIGDDAFVFVQATKKHSPELTSFVWLTSAAAVLARPNPAPGVRLEFHLSEPAKADRVRLLSGQPGIFYDAPEGLPQLYLYKVNPADPRFNKGVGELEIGIDLVVAEKAGSGGDTVQAPPPVAAADLPPLALPAAMHVRAVKAQTGLVILLPDAVTVSAAPAVQVDSAAVPAGGAVTATFTAAAGEQYSLLVNGTPTADPVAQTGEVSLHAAALPVGAVLELLVAPAAAGSVTVLRRLQLKVMVG